MKHMVQFLAGHKTHGSWVHGILELIFAFWKLDNFYLWRVMKPTIQRNVLPCSSFYAFWQPENAFSTDCEGRRVSPLSAFWALQNKISDES